MLAMGWSSIHMCVQLFHDKYVVASPKRMFATNRKSQLQSPLQMIVASAVKEHIVFSLVFRRSIEGVYSGLYSFLMI